MVVVVVMLVVVIVLEVVVEGTPMSNRCASILPQLVCVLVDVQTQREIAALLDNLLVSMCLASYWLKNVCLCHDRTTKKSIKF